MANKESLFKDLENTVLQLVQKYKITHKEIKCHLYKCLASAANNLPKIDVVYNDQYGGFGYSNDFRRFARKYLFPIENREAAVKTLKHYGDVKYIELPFIARLITIYVYYDLDNIFKSVSRIKTIKSMIEEQKNILINLENMNDSLFGTEELATQYLCSMEKYLKEFASKYTKSSLIAGYDNDCKNNEIILRDLYTKINISEETVQLILDSFSFLHLEEIENKNKPWYERTKWEEVDHNKLSFLDSIQRYGEDHWAIWQCQYRFSNNAMRFLLLHPKIFQCPDTIEPEILARIKLNLGLVCASSAYCNLVIGQVPQFVDWYIGEYDGKENICIPDSYDNIDLYNINDVESD